MWEFTGDYYSAPRDPAKSEGLSHNFPPHPSLHSNPIYAMPLKNAVIRGTEDLVMRTISDLSMTCFADDTGGKEFSPWQYPEIHTYEDETEEKA